jgi:hypothetical protein
MVIDNAFDDTERLYIVLSSVKEHTFETNSGVKLRKLSNSDIVCSVCRFFVFLQFAI